MHAEVADYTSVEIFELKDGEAVCAFEEWSAPGREGAKRHGRRARRREAAFPLLIQTPEFVRNAVRRAMKSAGRARETLVSWEKCIRTDPMAQVDSWQYVMCRRM